jgi:hypothetical protein
MAAKGNTKKRTTGRKASGVNSRKFNNSIKKVVYSIAEKKWYAGNIVNGTLNSTTWLFGSALTGINLGNQRNQRIGDKIYVQYIEWDITILPIVANVGGTGGVTRCVTYHNKVTNGAWLTGVQLFDGDFWNSMTNRANVPDKMTLGNFDRSHYMNSTVSNGGISVAAGPIQRFRCYQPVNKEVLYKGNAGTIADISKDDYGIAICTSMVNCCIVNCNYKVFYRDM